MVGDCSVAVTSVVRVSRFRSRMTAYSAFHSFMSLYLLVRTLSMPLPPPSTQLVTVIVAVVFSLFHALLGLLLAPRIRITLQYVIECE